MRKNKGITLVALVITIILLLILAGITISQLTENGLFSKVNEAKEKADESTAREIIITKLYDYQLYEVGKNKNATLEGLKEYLKADQEIEYIDLYVKRNDLEAVQTGETATHAKIKLKDYKYVYLLDQNLNIVQVDGKVIEDEKNKVKIDDELEKLLKEANMKITLDDILNTPAIMEQINGLIPKITENDVTKDETQEVITYITNESEVIRTYSESEQHYAWMAFDRDNSTSTISLEGNVIGYYIEYEFNQEVYAMQTKFKFQNASNTEGTRVIVIQGYDKEKDNWIELTNDITIKGNMTTYPETVQNLNYSKSYKKYRLFVKDSSNISPSAGDAHSGLYEMQLYGIKADEVKNNSEEELKNLLMSNCNLEKITLEHMVTNKEFTKQLINSLSIETVKNNETLMANLPKLIDKLTQNDVTRSVSEGVIEYTTTKGEIIRTNSEAGVNYQAWQVFDEDINTQTVSLQGQAVGYYVEYEFTQNLYAMKVKFRFANAASANSARVIAIQAYSEEENKWIDIMNDMTITGNSNTFGEIQQDLDYSKSYKRYRLFVKEDPWASNTGGSHHSGLFEMQFYGKR